METQLYHGDCATVMAERIPDDAIDLTVTSPPYDNLRTYNGYTFDFEAIAAQLWRVTKPGGVVVWVVADATINGSETGTSFRQALHFMSLGFNLHDTMIYKIKGTTQQKPVLRYGPCFEYMFVFSKGRPAALNIRTFPSSTATKIRSKRQRNNSFCSGYFAVGGGPLPNIWEYAVGSGNTSTDGTDAHPAPFPEALARDHILSWSNPGDLVLDPMMGSGTTIKMAILTGRQAIGIDTSAEYVELARRRIAKVEAQPFLFHPAETTPEPHGEQMRLGVVA